MQDKQGGLGSRPTAARHKWAEDEKEEGVGNKGEIVCSGMRREEGSRFLALEESKRLQQFTEYFFCLLMHLRDVWWLDEKGRRIVKTLRTMNALQKFA